jgi:hypothetical protein
VEAGARIEGSVIEGGAVGKNSIVRACRMRECSLGPDSLAEFSNLSKSNLSAQTTVSSFTDIVDVTAGFGTILGSVIHSAKMDTYLMSMHLAGASTHLVSRPRPVRLGNTVVNVPAVPMIGGGAMIKGSAAKPVEMECAFIGSNTIIEPGVFVGFGCFVLGTIGEDEGLLPFTISTGGGINRQKIGEVLTDLPSTILTHFVNWTFQAVGPKGLDGKGGEAVAIMVIQAIQEGVAAIESEQARRAANVPFDAKGPFARYRNLPHYSEEQLKSGLGVYGRILASGAWEIGFRGGVLCFTSPKGYWEEVTGAAYWKAIETVS